MPQFDREFRQGSYIVVKKIGFPSNLVAFWTTVLYSRGLQFCQVLPLIIYVLLGENKFSHKLKSARNLG